MLELQLTTDFEQPMSAVFTALVRALGEGRWFASGGLEDTASALPRSGLKYSSRRGGYACSGEVLECLRPVSIVLHESLHRARSGADCRQRWRIEPLESSTRVSCEVRANLSRIAALQKRQWHARLAEQNRRVCEDIRSELGSEPGMLRPQSGAIGQRIGSMSMVSTKITTVNGKPILR
jgi:uncharacterized protein YndB with AHSA1/START domain